ncbi:FtsQ-type POTRA domain-containing protein [candidate division WWE3 bacterium]|uniref:FtsQ-type POTRA domain-containing protein n=1 Tax=candidate division WWE3 bacterium TaxID=2053526 RepID=A0A7X9E6X6_UNCKA|nr:FtsQ-type POTRA domain-containing protein [candidate division WWE3 bacterium]
MKSLNTPKTKGNRSVKRYPFQVSPNAQVSGSDLVLKRINKRRKTFKNPKAVLRSHHGMAKKIFVSCLLVGVFVFIMSKFNILEYFKVNSIKVLGSSKFVNEKDIKTLVEKNSLGRSIFAINTENLKDTLKKNFLGAKNIEVEKDYPNTLKVVVEERTPIAILYNDKGIFYLIDSDGYVLGIVDKNYLELPKIRYEDDISVGNFLDKDIIPVSVDILKFAEKEELNVSSMSFYPKYTKIYVGSTEVYIGYDKSREKSIETVGALIKKLSVEGKVAKKIDLRYDKVIVLYD